MANICPCQFEEGMDYKPKGYMVLKIGTNRVK